MDLVIKMAFVKFWVERSKTIPKYAIDTIIIGTTSPADSLKLLVDKYKSKINDLSFIWLICSTSTTTIIAGVGR